MALGIDWGSVLNITATCSQELYLWVNDHVDVNYMQWLAWVFFPLILTILMPFVIVLLIIITALFLHLYQVRHNLFCAIKDVVDRGDFWNGARHVVCLLWDFYGKVWHGILLISVCFWYLNLDYFFRRKCYFQIWVIMTLNQCYTYSMRHLTPHLVIDNMFFKYEPIAI